MPIIVQGLPELRAAFRRVDKQLVSGLRSEMKAVAGIVASEAQRIAESEGLHLSGDLVKNIKPSVKGTTAIVRDNARRLTGKDAPFAYPKLYEYVRGRAFLNPALKEKEPEVYAALELMLDRIAAKF